jgi:hypothetical protein
MPPGHGDSNVSEKPYIPIQVAADVVGYSRSQVERLIRRGKVRACLVDGRRLVHLDSLIQYKRARRNRQRLRLMQWLAAMPPRQRDQLSYRNLAALACVELGLKVNQATIFRVCKRLGLPPRRRR